MRRFLTVRTWALAALVIMAGSPDHRAVAEQTPNAPGEPIDLLASNSWSCLPSARVDDRQLRIGAGGTYSTPVNDHFWLDTTGDFALSTTIGAATNDFAGISLFSAPARPNAEWWQGRTRLDIGLRDGRLAATGYDGSSPTATFARTFPSPSLGAGPVTVRVEQRAHQFVFFAEDGEVGRVDDSGLFEPGHLFVGANVAPGNLVTVDAWSIVPLGSASVSLVTPIATRVDPAAGPSLRSLASSRGLLIGVAVAPGPLRQDDAYRNLVAGQFNILTPENALKFALVHPEPDRYAFCDVDDIVAFAEANGMRVHGHTLVWHNQVPQWVVDGGFDRTQLLGILREHIQTVVSRYRGRIGYWDVVNEIMGDDGQLRDTFWLRSIGPDYIALAFQWAHEADPDAVLFYNEYGAEGMGTKSGAVYQFVRTLKEQGVPIGGVGLQTHVRPQSAPSADDLARNMTRLASLGVQVQVTEIDVRLPVPPSTSELGQQADIYQRILVACMHQPACTAFVGWNVYDGQSWIPRAFPGFGAAHLFDENFQPKPAYNALLRTLTGN